MNFITKAKLPFALLSNASRHLRKLTNQHFCTNCGVAFNSRQDDVSLPKRYLGQPTHYTHEHLLEWNEITPGITWEEYLSRRNAVMTAVGQSFGAADTKHVAIVLAADRKYMTDDIPYQFRQNTNFLYLTGFQEPDSVLLLESVPGREFPFHKSTLFVQHRDPEKELWDGPRAGTEGALQFLRINDSRPIGDLGEELQELVHRNDNLTVWYDVLKPSNKKLHQEVYTNLIQPCRNKGHAVNILENILHSRRVVKSTAEEKLMSTSASIAARAMTDVMALSQPGMNENSLYASIDYHCRLKGAEFLAYPPVVAGGNRANTLHYINNNQTISDNELVLMDAGCEYHGYASDITRTWPINGRFTSAQAAVYQAILDVQKDCIDRCTVGATLDQVYYFMLNELGKHLQGMGIVESGLTELDLLKITKQYCPHHVGHYLGMDTHDTWRVSRSDLLQPGMVVTVEPGLYFPESNGSIPAMYRGIGIRIEDDVLITTTGPQVLSAECPKEIKDLEELIQ